MFSIPNRVDALFVDTLGAGFRLASYLKQEACRETQLCRKKLLESFLSVYKAASKLLSLFTSCCRSMLIANEVCHSRTS